jgi:hypothetical protein|tara:strand:- start:8699 stop:9133 length:435 start_codon:yes stop_codon:yes gene_type:complete
LTKNTTELNDDTRFAMPVRNLITIISAVAVGVWAWFGVQERLNRVETQQILVQSDLEKNTEFRIKWPRGELGSLPADSEQFMLIEHLSSEFEKLATNLEQGKAPFDQQQALTLEFYEKRITSLEKKLDKLKDEVYRIKANGKGH